MSQSASALTIRQRQTLSARQAFAAKFSTREEQSAHFRKLGRRSAESRIVLSDDETAALADAYNLIGAIVARAQARRGQEHTEADDGVETVLDEPVTS